MTRSTDDLIALARRGELSPAEARRLAVYLGASDDARLIHDIGADYDRMQTVRPDDEALLERVGLRLIERHARGSRRSPSRWRAPALIGLGALLASAAAAAVGVFQVGSATSAVVGWASSAQRAPESAPQKATAAASEGQAEVSTAPEVKRPERVAPTDVGAPVPDATSMRSPAATASIPSESSDARALFSRANSERKAGRVAEALVTYAELRRRFPTSSEALLSRVLCGRLLLARGDDRAAAAEFAAYLAASPNGTLAEEALHGRAQALHSLGRTSDEHEMWRVLLERFPKSIHAKTARERLQRDR
jgi:TolA-binding protein